MNFATAQQSQLYEEDVSLMYRNEATIGINLHSNGWGANFRKGKHLTGYKKRFWEIETVSMHHPKEIKTSYNDNGKEFIYGKLNSLLLLRSGMGIQKTISSKGDRTGIEIRYNYAGGLSLGIAKPIYLYVSAQGMDSKITIEKSAPSKYLQDSTYQNIIGEAEFSYGMNELALHPGIYGRFGLTFEYGAYDTDVKAIETGIAVDAFPKVIPLMALTTNRNVYFSFYISLLLGRKW